ncbi:MAG: peptidylprolyl isomerase, partial [Patescibacteria group bacterium]
MLVLAILAATIVAGVYFFSNNNETVKRRLMTIKTNFGEIQFETYDSDAPKAVDNFVKLAGKGFYNNLTFHRVEDWVIQGGDPDGNGTGGGSIPVEFNSKPFVVGAVGIASRGDGKVQNDAQFFITKKDSQFLNGQYTNFGIVKS